MANLSKYILFKMNRTLLTALENVKTVAVLVYTLSLFTMCYKKASLLTDYILLKFENKITPYLKR